MHSPPPPHELIQTQHQARLDASSGRRGRRSPSAPPSPARNARASSSRSAPCSASSSSHSLRSFGRLARRKLGPQRLLLFPRRLVLLLVRACGSRCGCARRRALLRNTKPLCALPFPLRLCSGGGGCGRGGTDRSRGMSPSSCSTSAKGARDWVVASRVGHRDLSSAMRERPLWRRRRNHGPGPHREDDNSSPLRRRRFRHLASRCRRLPRARVGQRHNAHGEAGDGDRRAGNALR